MAATVIVLGSSNTDMVVPVHHIPARGETIVGGVLVRAAGGKGANQAVAAVRLGAQVRFVAAVGDDDLGGRTLDGLRAEGLDTQYVKVVPGVPSGVALICVDEQGDNSIAVSSGANSHLSANDVRAASGAFETSAALLVQLETPLHTVREGLRLGRNNNCITVLNPAPAPDGGLPDAVLSQVDVLTPNEGEVRSLAGGGGSPEESARILLSRGVGAVVVTLGAEGVLVASPGGIRSFPSHPVHAVDATGAGDAFSAGLAVALAEGRSLHDAAQFAVAVAALTVTRQGAQPSLPTRAEVEDLLSKG